jgi:hypothetical protein
MSRLWLIALLAGCGSTTNNYITEGNDLSITLPDGSSGPCTPNAKDCVSDALARVCPADGSGWLPVPCGATATCMNGDCVANAVSGFICIPGTTACLDESSGLKCRADGQGYTMINCPANTACTGAAKCVGSCTVGATTCITSTTYTTCSDGFTTMPGTCMTGTFCVTDASGNGSCKSGDCAPDPLGCNTVCGDKNNPANNQTMSTSTCVATPTGYHWLVTPCASGSCNPAGAGCGGGGTKAACVVTACVPNAQRCSSTGTGIDTCDANGNWMPAATPCNADPTNGQLICFTVAGKPVCGDPVCSGHAGTCDANANFIPCVNGKLAASGGACIMGICTSTGAAVGGVVPGACTTQCVTGDQKCVATGATSWQQCTSTGLWGAPMDCPSGSAATTHCFGYSNEGGRPQIVCGACAPGHHRCVSPDAGIGTIAIETCDSTGQWGAATGCAMGVCTPTFTGTDAECVVQCVPNAPVCLGPTKAGIGAVAGTASSGTCSPNGTLPPAPDCVGNPGAAGCCTGTTTCRRSQTGAAVGCVECVGPAQSGGNESGVPDTRCLTNPDAGTSAVQTCDATNVWPSTDDPCPPGTSCVGAGSFTCGGCFGVPNCTQSGLQAMYGVGVTCATVGGTATSCGGFADCCSNYCTAGGLGGGLSFCR